MFRRSHRYPPARREVESARDPALLWWSIAITALLAFVAHLSASHATAQSLYVIKGARGSITFTNRKPDDSTYYKVFVASKGPTFSRFYSIRSVAIPNKPVTSPYDSLILKTAEDHELDPALVKAVVHVESAFDPSATSPKGAMGLMQLMPGTAQRFGVSKPYHPSDNLLGGVKYLKMLYDRYRGNLRLALAAYNAGEGQVDRFKEVPPIRETQLYVRTVLKMTELYRCVLNGRQNC